MLQAHTQFLAISVQLAQHVAVRGQSNQDTATALDVITEDIVKLVWFVNEKAFGVVSWSLVVTLQADDAVSQRVTVAVTGVL